MLDAQAQPKAEGDGDGRFRTLVITYGLVAVVALLTIKLFYQHTEEMERLSVARQCAASQQALKQTVQEAVDEALKKQAAARPQAGEPLVEHVDTASIRLLDAMVSSGSVPQSSGGKVSTASIIALIQKIAGVGMDVAKTSPLMKLKDELLGMAKEITVAEVKKLIDKYLGLTEDGKKGGSHAGDGAVPYALNLTVYGQVNGQTTLPRPPAASGCGASGPQTPVVRKACSSAGAGSTTAESSPPH